MRTRGASYKWLIQVSPIFSAYFFSSIFAMDLYRKGIRINVKNFFS